MKHAFPVVLVLLGAACAPAAPESVAAVTFVSPADNAEVSDTVVVKMSVGGMKLVPATTPPTPGEGHLHVFVDVDPTPDSVAIPKTDGIYHIGTGADSLVLTLMAGKHRLIVVPTTSDHIPIKGAKLDTLNVEVKAPITPS